MKRFVTIPHSTSVYDNADPMNPVLVAIAATEVAASQLAEKLNQTNNQ